MMKILITGGTGLIGSALIPQLTEKYHVTLLTRQPQRAIERFGKQVQALKAWLK